MKRTKKIHYARSRGCEYYGIGVEGKWKGRVEWKSYSAVFFLFACPKQSRSWTFSSYGFEFQAESPMRGGCDRGVNDSNRALISGVNSA